MTEPTPGERLFLRGLASHGGTAWHSADSLAAAWPADFGGKSRQQISALGRLCVSKGWAESRAMCIHERAWKEYRITGAGRALVADSCIGGGLRWRYGTCPACAQTAGEMGVPGIEIALTIPAHPLPGCETTRR